MSKYYTESSGSSRRTSAFSGASTELLDKKSRDQKSDRSRQKSLPKAPQVMPIRIRRYYEKESDSSGVCDSGKLEINF